MSTSHQNSNVQATIQILLLFLQTAGALMFAKHIFIGIYGDNFNLDYLSERKVFVKCSYF